MVSSEQLALSEAASSSFKTALAHLYLSLYHALAPVTTIAAKPLEFVKYFYFMCTVALITRAPPHLFTKRSGAIGGQKMVELLAHPAANLKPAKRVRIMSPCVSKIVKRFDCRVHA